jgi:hypothetical protein
VGHGLDGSLHLVALLSGSEAAGWRPQFHSVVRPGFMDGYCASVPFGFLPTLGSCCFFCACRLSRKVGCLFSFFKNQVRGSAPHARDRGFGGGFRSGFGLAHGHLPRRAVGEPDFFRKAAPEPSERTHSFS